MQEVFAWFSPYIGSRQACGGRVGYPFTDPDDSGLGTSRLGMTSP
jgi:hypothetical protein